MITYLRLSLVNLYLFFLTLLIFALLKAFSQILWVELTFLPNIYLFIREYWCIVLNSIKKFLLVLLILSNLQKIIQTYSNTFSLIIKIY